MDSSMFIALMAFVGTLAVLFVISTLAERRQPAVVRRRLDDHAVDVAVREAKRLERIDVLKGQSYSAVPTLDSLLRRFKPARTAHEELVRADLLLSVPQYLLARIFLAVGIYVALRMTSLHPMFAVAAVIPGVMLPRVALILAGRRRLKAFEGQLAEAIDLLVGALRAGYGFLQGIESVTKEMGGPMRVELVRVLEQINVGVNPVDALQSMTERIDSYDLSLFVSAVSVQRTAGGNLAEVLENIADTVRERRRIRAEVSAITTGPRVSSYILGAIPVGLLLVFVSTNVEYRRVMLGSTIGHVMIAVAAIWSFTGMMLSKAVAKVEY